MLKTDVDWPKMRRYSSNSAEEPILFFSESLCNASNFDLMLGFFSSSAINALADGFAAFIYNGGRMRMVINDILSAEDKTVVSVGESDLKIPYFDLDSLDRLRITLSNRDIHFFECLSWLIRNNRIEIVVIVPKSGKGIAHSKFGIFNDVYNKVAFDGSCNFTRTALIENIESISVFCDWDSPIEQDRIMSFEEEFNRTFEGRDKSVTYKKVDAIRCFISNSFGNKEIKELLGDEANLIQQDLENSENVRESVNKALTQVKIKVDRMLESINNGVRHNVVVTPRFPYESGPRNYQLLAYENWKHNGQKGLFAMATGTGKTLTSLNCLLQIYNKFKYYKAIILVPTVTLVDQWEKECGKFHFDNIIKVCSKNHNWKSDVDAIKLREEFCNEGGINSFIIIATYASFAREKIFKDLVSFSKKTCRQLLLIADEAHNMGAGRILDRLGSVKFLRRIGLSATPERQYDDSGNKAVMDFFGCHNSYTYEYSMKEAIDNGFLCRYKYYPHLVKLNDEEMSEYMRISLQLAKFFNKGTDSFPKSDDIIMRLLLKRKRIIHKAKGKEQIFEDIIKKRYSLVGNLKYTLVYVPEGTRPDNEDSDCYDTNDTIEDDGYSDSLIDTYSRIVQSVSNTTTVKKFISGINDREGILEKFAKGEIEVLTSMKCLDEGIDVPRSEMAIFCASTGNPRQFIQRRGRILRNHADKHMAILHDLVVAPEINFSSENYNMERNMLCNELKRVRDFAVISENADYAYEELSNILSYYKLSLF